MGGGLTSHSKIVDCGDEASAKQPCPDVVDCDARCQGMPWVDQPLGEVETVRPLVFLPCGEWMSPSDHSQSGVTDFLFGRQEISAVQDFRSSSGRLHDTNCHRRFFWRF